MKFWEILFLGVLAAAVCLMLIMKKKNLETIRWERETFLKKEAACLCGGKEKILPQSVEKWLQRSGAEDLDCAVNVCLKQKGRMRLSPEGKWLISVAEQHVRTDLPGFFWTVRAGSFPGMVFSGRDLFDSGKGRMNIWLFGILPVVSVAGNAKTDQSSLQRYLMEMVWYPQAARCPYLEWEELGGKDARVTMKSGDTAGSAVFSFDDSGDIKECTAMRYKENTDEAELCLCRGRVLEYGEIGGMRLPVRMDVSWQTEAGFFTWYELEITDCSVCASSSCCKGI